MAKKRIATIEDLARAAGVSSSTVSRVLNHSGYVGKKTRQTVENVIKAHGFIPNAAARSLSTARTALVGLIIPSFDNPVYLEILKGVNSAAIQNGYSVVLSESGEDPENIKRSMMHLAALQVDGIAAASPEVHDVDIADYLTAFISEKIPISQLGDADTRWRIDGVAADSHESGRLAAEHLVRLGHERIGVVGSVLNAHVKRRVEGIREVLLKSGLRPTNILSLEADFTQAGGYRAIQGALAGPGRPDALIALNDVMAIGGLLAAEEAGVAVPRELAVVGIDGIPLGSLTRPRLSSVVLPTFEMGCKLFELIHTRLTGAYDGEARQVVFHPRLAARESSMAVRQY